MGVDHWTHYPFSILLTPQNTQALLAIFMVFVHGIHDHGGLFRRLAIII